MELYSTNGSTKSRAWSQGVLEGLAPDGGLYLPTQLPKFSSHDLARLSHLPFAQLAYEVARILLCGELPTDVVSAIATHAFNFELPLIKVADHTFVLELFHGPTCAFKDFGARFMAGAFRYLLSDSDRKLTVLVATSGDTGSAVANAFFDPDPNAPIQVAILFPKGRVSRVQEQQITTLGHNVTAFEVEGSFDLCQALVKEALSDQVLRRDRLFTSANSINIARLIPQIFYYIYAALKFARNDAPVFAVPSGNLGNLTGGILAAFMGAPAAHFIAACNDNAPFPKLLQSGVYTPHPSNATISNAMDVGDPSNYRRINHLFDSDLNKMRSMITGAQISELRIIETIAEFYEQTNYIMDPHTAVAAAALHDYRLQYGTKSPGVILATAHPAKFGETVKRAIRCEPEPPQALLKTMQMQGNKISLDGSYASLKAALQDMQDN